MADIRDEMTERLLVDAGIGAGMRVIDVGCGAGAVSFRIARLVGERGQVLGVDRNPQPLALAREQARELNLSNVTFIEGDFSALSSEHGQFDAAVGRRVLMYQPDPVHAVRQLAAALRPGGLVIFQEQDRAMVPASVARLPLHQRVYEWMWRTVEREGADLHMGFNLAPVLEQAGLTVEQIRAEAVVQTPKSYYSVERIIRAMLPRIIERGVATEQELDVEALDQRLLEERQRANATFIGDMVFGAWARKPA
jgi:ubiquinone/menaquinone biosynthesis C-methylase UbiE